ncbi:MAG: acetate--CoA ligase family protein, partial [Candidatus Competibacterales bacterium]|nr:acetate--CoA ligase family protein [Candidatus Competibacterales bacterium]
MYEHYLTKLFKPRSVAVFGANDHMETVGAQTFRNILQGGYKGQVYAINPKRETVQEQPSYPNLEAVGEPVDLAVIATPAKTTPAIIEECGRLGTRAAIVMSAGFREIGEEGKRIERRLLDTARKHDVRFLGPNCLGMLRPGIGLNATFSKNNAHKGKLALVSQSGALCTAIMDWAESKNIGFSSIISAGISADINFGELIDFLVSDNETAAILLYLEGLQNSRRFMSALRVAARAKPVVVMKSGRHEAGTKAAVSHSGALVGADDAFDAAFERAGVVRVRNFGDFFAAARILSSGLRVGGDRLAIITNGGGPGIMATDHLMDRSLRLAELGEDTLKALNAELPATWSHANPVDIIGDAPPERYRAAVEILLRDKAADAVLVILTPQAMTDPEGVAQALTDLHKQSRKPMLCCWMGDALVGPGRALLQASNIPSFNTPEAAVDAFYYLASYQRNQELLLQVPAPISTQGLPDTDGARMIIENALNERRKVLGEMEAKALLNAFRIPIARAFPVGSYTDALVMATEIGFPVVMKINSHDITHKSDVGGVRLNITDGVKLKRHYDDLMQSVSRLRPDARLQGVIIEEMCLRPHARELMLGVVSDPVFGPI